MTTTKETMKVIAGGLDKKEEPEVIMDGKVIAVEMPDELAEVFERLVETLISKCEDKDADRSESNQSNMNPQEDGYFMKVEEMAALIGVWHAIRAAENMVITEMQLEVKTSERNKPVEGIIILHNYHILGNAIQEMYSSSIFRGKLTVFVRARCSKVK